MPLTTDALIAGMKALIAEHEQPAAEPFRLVTQFEDLQTALDTATVPIHLVAGATYPGVTLPVGARLVGHLAILEGVGRPALRVLPGASGITVSDLRCVSDWNGPVVQLGNNDASQTTVAQVPTDIRLERVIVPTHRGKRAFEINSARTVLQDCQALDVYADTRQDSQGIYIQNTYGGIQILGGLYEAGSENIIVGGDTFKLTDAPDGVVADILIDGVTLRKPEEWRTTAANEAAKNILELKAGKRITVRKCVLSGSWRQPTGPTQDGSAIVITPKNAQFIEDVLIEDNVIDRCAQGVQLMGNDYNSVTPKTTNKIVFRGNTWRIDGPAYNGRGVLALVVGGMADVLWENETVVHTGNSLFLVDSQTPTGPFTVRGSRMTTGKLAVAAPGVNYGGPTPAAYAGREFTLIAEGNTFTGAPSQFRGFYPNNVFVS